MLKIKKLFEFKVTEKLMAETQVILRKHLYLL